VVPYAGDRALRSLELDRLLDRVRAGQDALAYADGRIQATIHYGLPALLSASVPAHVRVSLGHLVEGAARDRVPDVAEGRRRVVRCRVAPWHDAIRRARSAYAAYISARLTYLRSGSRHLDVLLTPHLELEAALQKAERTLLAAGARPALVRSALHPPPGP
jgi:hypothetical protein